MGEILVIKTGKTMPALIAQRGDFEDWILSGMQVAPEQAQVLDVCSGAPLPDPGAFGGVVVTGSHAMVTEHAPWSERTAVWLREVVECGIPLLGICYGHQLLAYALGGEVSDNPRGLDFGTTEVHLAETARQDALFTGLGPSIRGQVCHTQTVLRLPPGVRLLAWGKSDRHLAFAAGERAWGVQFHPEFDAEVMRAYTQAFRAALLAEGQDPDAIIANCADVPFSTEILRRFAKIAGVTQPN
jgi:GMP synthase (glutamine-hydrolysing)